MSDFKIGDRVRWIGRPFTVAHDRMTVIATGELGVVVAHPNDAYVEVGVEGKGCVSMRCGYLRHFDDADPTFFLRQEIDELRETVEELQAITGLVDTREWWKNEFGPVHKAVVNSEDTRALAILRKHAAGHDPHKSPRFVVTYEGDDNFAVCPAPGCSVTVGAVYFPTREAAEAALDEAGKTALKRLMEVK